MDQLPVMKTNNSEHVSNKSKNLQIKYQENSKFEETFTLIVKSIFLICITWYKEDIISDMYKYIYFFLLREKLFWGKRKIISSKHVLR